MKLRYALICSVIALGGCANGKITHDTSVLPKSSLEAVEKVFIGIPLLASMEGSTVRLDDTWVLTAAHNKPILEMQLKDVYYHPTCDIAIYKEPLKGFEITYDKVYIKERVFHTGYPVGLPMSVNAGEVIGNVNMKKYPECRVVATTGVVAKGMSGGGVFDTDGNLLGINHGYATSTIYWNNGTSLQNGGLFLPLSYVNDWIEDITGKQLFND
ncbi:putative serine protease [Vibrio phage VPMCC14]|nr:putative serine protease [Vibrio phage VPMCC14]